MGIKHLFIATSLVLSFADGFGSSVGHCEVYFAYPRSHSLFLDLDPITYALHDKNHFAVIEGRYREFFFDGIIEDDGTLVFFATLVHPATGVRSRLHGPRLFREMIDFLGFERIERIGVNWSYGTNLQAYETARLRGASPDEAVWKTWSGGLARSHGFTEVNKIHEKIDRGGRVVSVTAFFEKPNL